MLAMIACLAVPSFAAASDPWAADFAAQKPSAALRLECRYTDASRVAAEVLGDTYELLLHLADADKGRAQLLNAVPAGRTGLRSELHLEVESGGVVYSSLHAAGNSRINLYRRGPYYIEVHWLDVMCATEAGETFPAQGEVVFFAYPDRLLAQVTWHAIEGAEAMPPGVCRLVWSAGESASTPFGSLKPGDKPSVALPLLGVPDVAPASIELLDGVDAAYEAVRGCYVVRTDNPGGFSYHYYTNPNHYETARFRVRNGPQPQKVYVCHATRGSPGSVECGVVLDADTTPLPIQVQISKNFAGEIEEPFYTPTDIPFSETFFPLHLAANEDRELTSLHLYQNWGNHPLKQFSSLGAWMDYYHSSTGVTETTCFVPFKFGGLPGVAIADLRAMSQPVWESQPQHDNVAGHRFLMYRANEAWHYGEYTGTTFRSTGPNWMDISLGYLSDDGALRARLDSFELPQTDELRNFVRLRIEVEKPLRVANLATDFRLLDITTAIQQLRYKRVAWQSAEGRVETRELRAEDALAVAGEPLGGSFPWATAFGDKRGCNSFVVRSFSARIGKETLGPAVVAQTSKSGDLQLALTVNGGEAELRPGDVIEADFYIMPYGTDQNTCETPERDRVPFGENAPRVTRVKSGRKLADFPTRLRATKRGKAEFSVAGGVNLIPIIVEGLPTHKRPRLEVRTEAGEWEPVRHETVGSDGYQVFVDEAGTFGCVFLVNADGAEHAYRVALGEAPPVKVVCDLQPPEAVLANLVYVQAPWMSKPVNLRYPETIISDYGVQFIDHVREDMPGKTPISSLADWHAGPGGSWWYDWAISDHCRAGGIVSPGVDEVTFESWFANGGEKATWVDLQFCLRLWDDLFRDETGERSYIVSDGKWVRMADTDRGRGRRELSHYPCVGGLELPENADATSWGRAAVTSDFGLVAGVSPDGKHVLGLAWPQPKSILSNWLIPCFHADPLLPTCPAKERIAVRGRIYLLKGTLDDLLARYRADFADSILR
jgi:hypothetical protein